MHPGLYLVCVAAPMVYHCYAVVDDFSNLVEVQS